MQVLLITPTRFIASGGKLDSDKRYASRAAGGRFAWPGASTETIFQSGGHLHIKNIALTGGYATGWTDPKEMQMTI
jgi:hypothetical protein